jgi:hypothetical protein
MGGHRLCRGRDDVLPGQLLAVEDGAVAIAFGPDECEDPPSGAPVDGLEHEAGRRRRPELIEGSRAVEQLWDRDTARTCQLPAGMLRVRLPDRVAFPGELLHLRTEPAHALVAGVEGRLAQHLRARLLLAEAGGASELSTLVP